MRTGLTPIKKKAVEDQIAKLRTVNTDANKIKQTLKESDIPSRVLNAIIEVTIGAREIVESKNRLEACSFSIPGSSDATSTWGVGRGTLKTPLKCLQHLQSVAKFGAKLKRRAAYWATENVATSSSNTRLRIEMVNFAQFTAEYGNQITARADALFKQFAGANGAGIARQQLANSVYLRDSAPTAYLNLYDWADAAVKYKRTTTAAERTRMVKQLVADNYWSNINTVFAAGQGSVSAALVKDDVGNWNMKSFDNSPGDLLDAYKSVGLAAVKTVAGMATSANGLSGAQKALKLADQVALGSTSGDRADKTVTSLGSLRAETAARITNIGKRQQSHLTKLATAIKAADGQVASATKIRDDAQTEVNSRAGEVGAEEKRIEDRQKDIDGFKSDLVSGNKTPEEEKELRQQIIKAQDDQAGAMTKLAGLQAALVIKQKDLAQKQGTLDEANGAKKALQTEEKGVPAETARQIREVLALHRAMVDQMEKSAIAGSGSDA